MHTERQLLEELHAAGLTYLLPVLLRLRLTPEQWLEERGQALLEEYGVESWSEPDFDVDEDDIPTLRQEPLTLEMPDADAYLAARSVPKPGAPTLTYPPSRPGPEAAPWLQRSASFALGSISDPTPQPRLKRGVIRVAGR